MKSSLLLKKESWKPRDVCITSFLEKARAISAIFAAMVNLYWLRNCLLTKDFQHPIVQGVSNVEVSHCIDRHAFVTIQISTNCSLGSVSSSAAISRK
jgi:hypothetical protein